MITFISRAFTRIDMHGYFVSLLLTSNLDRLDNVCVYLLGMNKVLESPLKMLTSLFEICT